MATSDGTAKVEDGGAAVTDDSKTSGADDSKASGGDSDVDVDLATKFAAYCDVRTKDHFTSKACNKLVKDCFEEHFKFKKVILTNRIDSSVFSKCKEKGKQFMVVNPTNCEQFLRYAAFEIGKLKKGDEKLSKEDPVVGEVYGQLKDKVVKSKGPIIKKAKQSATGNVQGLTDTTKYTGSHKLRFDESGKGRGKAGRVDEKNTSGYVASYSKEGTYDEEHKEEDN